MKRQRIRIDRQHTRWLLQGDPIAIKVPPGAQVLELELTMPPKPSESGDSIAEIFDVFFNGRPAKARRCRK